MPHPNYLYSGFLVVFGFAILFLVVVTSLKGLLIHDSMDCLLSDINK